jgi:hypothetical protein
MILKPDINSLKEVFWIDTKNNKSLYKSKDICSLYFSLLTEQIEKLETASQRSKGSAQPRNKKIVFKPKGLDWQ